MTLSPEIMNNIETSDSVSLLTYLEHPDAYTSDAVEFAKQEALKRGGISVVSKEARLKAEDDLKQALSVADGCNTFALSGTAQPEVKRRIAEIVRAVESNLKSLADVATVTVKVDHHEDSTHPEMFSNITYALVVKTQKKIGADFKLRWNRSMGMLIRVDSRVYSRSDSFFDRHRRIAKGVAGLGGIIVSIAAYLLGIYPGSYTTLEWLILSAILIMGGGIITYQGIQLINWLFIGSQARRENKVFLVQAHDAATRAIVNMFECNQKAG